MHSYYNIFSNGITMIKAFSIHFYNKTFSNAFLLQTPSQWISLVKTFFPMHFSSKPIPNAYL